MKDLRDFATEKFPVHPSGIRKLLTCNWSVVMRFLEACDDEGGVAGDTGSAMHVAVAGMHTGKGTADCLEAMRTRVSEYPKADLADAAALFLKYAADPRQRNAKVLLSEAPVKFKIQAAEEDPTGEAIVVEGTLDQLREVDGQLYVYDLKTSKKDPIDLLNNHTFQVAAYCVGAAALMGRPVHPGALILPRKYREDAGSSPVFWHYPWKFDDLQWILQGLRHVVAAVRSGHVHHVPSADCQWCHAKSPDLCFPKLKEARKAL